MASNCCLDSSLCTIATRQPNGSQCGMSRQKDSPVSRAGGCASRGEVWLFNEMNKWDSRVKWNAFPSHFRVFSCARHSPDPTKLEPPLFITPPYSHLVQFNSPL